MTARRLFSAAVIAAALAFAAPTFAQKPANAPKNSTGQCSDNTFTTAKTERGACSKHGGVKTWWGATTPKSTAKSGAPTPSATSSKGTATPKGSTPTTEGSKPPSATSSATPGTPGAATMPQGATGQCADGSYTKAKTQRGACSNHGGVKTWFGNATSGTVKPTNTQAPTTSPAAAPTNPPTSASTQRTGTRSAATKTPPADAPQGATAKCKDGTYSMAKQHRGACSRHGGVAEWYK